jgi:hypothetical protein
MLNWPIGQLVLGAPVPTMNTVVTMLGGKQESLGWIGRPQGGIIITFPEWSFYDMPSKWAWVFKMTNIKN